MQARTPATALDTVWGSALRGYIQNVFGKDVCTPCHAYYAYTACVMSSDDYSEDHRFNILQFADEIIPINYHGAHCNRLEQFMACWSQLQGNCGPTLQGLEHHAMLLVEGCRIQSDMDIAGCPWQDILLPHYIQANKVTTWPLGAQGLNNPMWLEKGYYNRNITKDIANDLERGSSLLQPGLKEEFSRLCGQIIGTDLESALNKLGYFQYDAWKWLKRWAEAQYPTFPCT